MINNILKKFSLNKKKVFVLGGCGLIGLPIVNAMLSASAEVYVIDNNKKKGLALEKKFKGSKLKFIYLNINVEPLEDNVLDINENNLKFKQEDYEIELELSNSIDTEKCKINKNRIFELDLPKKEHKFWTNLLKDSTLYKNNISINWNRWVDEDDDEDIYNILNEDNDTSDDEIENNDISIGEGLFRKKLTIADNTYSKIDKEIITISKLSLNKAIDILKKNRLLLDKLVEILLNLETIDKDTFKKTTLDFLKV